MLPLILMQLSYLSPATCASTTYPQIHPICQSLKHDPVQLATSILAIDLLIRPNLLFQLIQIRYPTAPLKYSAKL